MSAVADHAGVRRSTLYRHFPDEDSLFQACSSHWAASNPPPDIEAWAAISDPDARLKDALEELYEFFGRTERMMENLFRDEELNPTLKRTFAAFYDYMDGARAILMKGRGLKGAARRRVQAAIGHALAFSTWRSLVRDQGLSAGQAVELMCALVGTADVRPK